MFIHNTAFCKLFSQHFKRLIAKYPHSITDPEINKPLIFDKSDQTAFNGFITVYKRFPAEIDRFLKRFDLFKDPFFGQILICAFMHTYNDI